MDAANELPATSQLLGIDVSPVMFPKKAFPPNAKFEAMSVASLHAHWSDQFDFVHHRLLIGGLRAEEWPIALSEYKRVLKPGGHVQLTEIVSRLMSISGPAGKSFADHCSLLSDVNGRLYDCAEQLPYMLKKAGFVNIRAEMKLMPCGEVLGPDGRVGKDIMMGVRKSHRDACIRMGVVENDEALYKAIDEMGKEWEEIGGFYFTVVIAVAEKPHSDPKP